MTRIITIIFIINILNINIYAQEFKLSGYVYDSTSVKVLAGASIIVKGTSRGVVSNNEGHYSILLKDGENAIVVSYLGYEPVTLDLHLQPGEIREVQPVLIQTAQDLDEVIIRDQHERATTINRIDIKTLDMLPNVSGNLESILATMPGVSSRSELSSQYSVRGGNFDENLVYVNNIEIHRPFLVRSGQQEGLSFINPDMVARVTPIFSARIDGVVDLSGCRFITMRIKTALVTIRSCSASFQIRSKHHFRS